MEVKIDRDGCIGCGLCAELCPEAFRMAEDGLAEVHDVTGGGNEAGAKEAAEDCPVSVIAVE